MGEGKFVTMGADGVLGVGAGVGVDVAGVTARGGVGVGESVRAGVVDITIGSGMVGVEPTPGALVVTAVVCTGADSCTEAISGGVEGAEVDRGGVLLGLAPSPFSVSGAFSVLG